MTNRRINWLEMIDGSDYVFGAELPSGVDVKPFPLGLAALARQLSQINRFNGATDAGPYSVAQHSVIVSAILDEHGPATALHGLLHDAHETVAMDMTRPLKNELRDRCPEAAEVLGDIADEADARIFPMFGLTWPMPADIKHRVKWADNKALATERRDLMAGEDPWPDLPPPLAARIRPWGHDAAAAMFVRRFRDLNIQLFKTAAQAIQLDGQPL